MIILLWQLLGRINKISFLRLSKLSMQEQTGAINVSLLRSKGGKDSPKAIICHRQKRQNCFFHSLGSYLITAGVGDGVNDYMFPSLNHDSPARYVNILLAPFGEKHKTTLSSSSGRHGSASHANSHSLINLTWIVERGDWTFDAICTAFECITGSLDCDHKVAHVLSGWPNPNSGGWLAPFSR